MRRQTAQILQVNVMLVIGPFYLILFSARALYVFVWLFSQIVLFSARIGWAIIVFIKNLIQGFTQGFQEVHD